MGGQSLQLSFSTARFPATTWSDSLSTFDRVATCRCVSHVAARKRTAEESVPSRKIQKAVFLVIRQPPFSRVLAADGRNRTRRGSRRRRLRRSAPPVGEGFLSGRRGACRGFFR